MSILTKPVSAPPKRLAESITLSSLSFKLSDIKNWDGTDLSAASFGTKLYAAFRNSVGTALELVEVDPTTITAASSAITFLKRGLSFNGDRTTEITANKLTWVKGDTIVQFGTDTPQLLQAMIDYIDAAVIAGGAPASTTTMGFLEKGTAAEITADTANGATGAPLAVTPDQLILSKYGLQLPSAAEKAALAGTSGTPSGANKFVTAAGLATYVVGDTTFGPDQSQTTTAATYAVGEANATTKHALVAQSFVPTVTGIKGVRLWKIADTGSFTGTVKVALQANSGSSPSGVDLASLTIANAAWLRLTNAAEFSLAFSTEYESLVVGATYWIVVTPSTSDNSNHPNLGYDNASAHSLVLKFNNSTDGWVATATAALYFRTNTGVLNKVVKTDPTTGLIHDGVLPYSFITAAAGTTAVNTLAETQVFSKQLAGGIFTLKSGLHIRLFCSATTGNTGAGLSSTANIYLGTNLLATIGFGAVDSNSVITKTSQLDFYILNNNSLSSQTYSATALEIFTSLHATFATTYVNSSSVAVGTTTVNTALTPDALRVTFTNGNAVSYTTSCDLCIIEKIG